MDFSLEASQFRDASGYRARVVFAPAAAPQKRATHESSDSFTNAYDAAVYARMWASDLYPERGRMNW